MKWRTCRTQYRFYIVVNAALYMPVGLYQKVSLMRKFLKLRLGFKLNLICYRRRICRMKIFQLLA